GDLYNPLKHKQPILDTVKNIHAVATSLEGDYDVFCRNYPHRPKIKFIYSAGFDFTRIPDGATKERLIVVGNSGDPSNCHIEILKCLAGKQDIKDYQILIPLAYNLSEIYLAEIGDWLKKLNLISCVKLIL